MVALGANLAKRHITNVKVVIMTTTNLRAAKYSPQKFVDWLLACDIHFILSHVHQSLNFWDCREIGPQYTRLIGHRGFPTGQQHFCCIFLQDKIIYLHALRDYCNPTVQVHIPWCKESKEVDIFSMSMIPLEAGRSFVVKTPFTTNCDHFKIVHSLEEVTHCCLSFNLSRLSLICCLVQAIERVQFISDTYSHQLPYVMIQACMTNRREAKVVCLNGEPLFVANIDARKMGTSFSKHPHLLLFDFVRRALGELKVRQPQSLLDGLVRVDVFHSSNNGLVVNEFESLEANFYSKQHLNELMVEDFLERYWGLQLARFLY